MPIITGTTGADTLTGTSGDDTIDGREGADVIHGGDGNDVLESGYTSTAVQASMNVGSRTNPFFISYFVINDPGGNRLYGEAGNDTLTGGTNDILDGGVGDDLLQAIALGELFTVPVGRPITMIGGDGNDQIIVSGYRATVDGGSGDDIIDYRSGYAGRVTTGSGSDLVIVAPAMAYTIGNPDGPRVITDFTAGNGPGHDTLAFTGVDANLQILGIPYYLGSTLRIGQDGADTVIFDLSLTYVRLLNVNAASLTSANIAAMVGQTAVGTNPGPVYQLGSAQADAFFGTASADYYDGGAGDDVLIGGDGDDRLFGNAGSDILRGGAGNDYLNGGYTSGDNWLDGGAGDDILVGVGSGEVLDGGSGRDTFAYGYVGQSSPQGTSTIVDFETGVDRLDFAASPDPATDLIISRQGNQTYIFAAFGPNRFPALNIAINGQVALSDIAYRGTPQVTLVGDDQANTLTGTARGDGLLGGGGADVLIGGGGGDALGGGSGADVFRYLATSDSTSAGADNLFDFETGIDTIDLTALNATSISVIRGADGSSFIFAETPAGGFMVTAAGRAVGGGDFTYGGTFGVYLVGSSASETLIGSSRADPISGGAGNDTIIGGGSADVLFGDGGADTFVYRAASESTTMAADTVFGFVSGLDRIDLSGVRTGAADTFGIAYLSGGSFLFVDLGGNGSNDMLIQLANTTLRTSDVLWSTTAIPEEPGIKTDSQQVLPVILDDAGFDGLAGGWLTLDPASAPIQGSDWFL